MALLPKVKLKTLPTFPSVINGGAGIDVTMQNGAATVDLTYSDFGTISSLPTSPTSNILTYDTATKRYVMIPSSLLGGAVAGIADAPNDGFQYGRQSTAWTPITSNFIQGGSGAVTRTLQNKAREVLSVKDFGAVGDGVADDTAKIVAAVTYANSIGGGRVHFPHGTYLVSSSMVFSNFRNITCQGEGVDATVIKAWSGGTFTNGLFSYSGGAYLKHNGITFDVNNKSVGTLIPAIFFVSATDIEVSDCEILHMSTLGIGTSVCNNIRILRNRITLDTAFNSQNNGILISGNSNDVWIDSNDLNRTGMLLAATNCWVTNNNCHDYKYGGGLGCTGNIAGQSGPYYVIGNTCSGGSGIDTDGTYVAGMEFNGFGGICANNSCFNNYGVGIASFSYGSAITGNVCYNNGTGGSALHCAGILGAYQAAGQFFGNNVISGNTCFDTAGSGGTQKFGYQDVGDVRCGNNTFSANNFDHNATAPVSMASTNSYQGAVYSGILAYAGGVVPTGTSATFNVPVPNANAGDFAIGNLDSYAGQAAISAKSIGSGLVAVTVSNLTGSSATLPAGNFRAIVIKG